MAAHYRLHRLRAHAAGQPDDMPPEAHPPTRAGTQAREQAVITPMPTPARPLPPAPTAAGHDAAPAAPQAVPTLVATPVSTPDAALIATPDAAVRDPVTNAISVGVLRLIDGHPLAAATSISVRDAATGALIVARNADRPVPPASNAKLLTAIAALDTLGATHRFTTSVETVAPPAADGAIRGDLRLVGGGDPSLDMRDLRGLARDVRAAGICRVDGSVIGDDTLLDQSRWVDAWPHAARLRDARALGALSVAEDPSGTRLPANAVPDPALHTARMLTIALEDAGVDVAGEARATAASPAIARTELVTPATTTHIADHSSAPLAEIITFMLRRSNSTTAEVLTRHVGAATSGSPTTAAGAAAIRARIPTDDLRVTVVDGSGLAHADRITTAALTDLLVAVDSDPSIGAPLRDALATAGHTGTIAHRMAGTPAEGRVHAKTGTLHDTSALSGYVDRDDGRRLAFSMVMHGEQSLDVNGARALQDAVAGALAGAGITPARPAVSPPAQP